MIVNNMACLQVRTQLESSQQQLREVKEANSRLTTELNARVTEVEQLTTLSLRGDATVQEYMANLKLLSAGTWCTCIGVWRVVSKLSAMLARSLARVSVNMCRQRMMYINT